MWASIYAFHEQINCIEAWNSEKNCKTGKRSLINESYKSLITDVLENTYSTQNFILHKLFLQFSYKYSITVTLK